MSDLISNIMFVCGICIFAFMLLGGADIIRELQK